MKRKKWRNTILVILAIIIVVRISLPFVILDYVNKSLKNLEGYGGHVEDIDLKFENAAIPALNDFVSSYLKADFESGTFNLYAEIFAENGQISGYVKPVIEN
jgi:hypothetical protein